MISFVISRLIDNAIHYSKQGEITLSMKSQKNMGHL